jgi:urease accessory protein
MNPNLLLLADGRFPAGGHSWSAGVEAAVNIGDVADADTLERYLAGRLATTGTVDAAFATAACAAALRTDPAGGHLGDLFAHLDREYDARTPSAHLRATSRRLGRHFARAACPIWPGAAVDAAALTPGGAHQSIVLGAVVAAAAGSPADAAAIALHHTATAVTTAAVRLLGLDPIALAAVARRCVVAATPAASTVDTWASCEPAGLPAAGGSLTEILGEHHGHLDARLFVA